jgi:two-component system OmpR family sensor kinase
MIKTLYGKITLTLLVLFILIGALNLFQTLITTKLYNQEVNQKLHRALSNWLVTETFYIKEGQADVEALKKTFETLMHINPNIELYLLDPKGKILAFSAPEGRVKRESVSLSPLLQFLDGESTLPILGDDPRDPDRKKVFSAARIPAKGPIEGYLYVILGGEEYDSVASRFERSYILRLSIWIAVAGLFFVFVTGLFLFNLLTRRLRGLSQSLHAFQKCDFQEPIPQLDQFRQASKDEIGNLGQVVHKMSRRIIDQMDTIKQADEHRREMVSNISHDLRTPLSSLQGYLETLVLKKDALSPEERSQYLETALKQSHRLGRLVTDLFELAKLDAPEVQINPEPFNLGELIQDIIQKYKLAIEKKDIKIRAAYPEALPLAHADIGLIERALQNLIDNAIAYSERGDSISLEIIPQEDRITVSVSDEGKGIDKEDLPYIFNRFYQGKSREKVAEDDSTGLGLAIAKRIMDLHGSPLEVESEPDRGTRFTFYLKVFSTAF